MNVLIAYASTHGSTLEIAEEIGSELTSLGCNVAVLEVSDVQDLRDFQGVVLGSAIYFGHWLTSAAQFVEKHAEELRDKQVWLFSSGPIGDPPRPNNDLEAFSRLVRISNAREHAIFNGKLVRAELNFCERIAARVAGAAEGDFRDWPSIRAWSQEIGRQLGASEENPEATIRG
jgi:menaquinone-dependent protoporphyrinogen oxidase